jgi:septal ring factor EnvC (AmiA/AmiB activator)
MKKTLNSLIIALLILSNLYTLKTLQDYKLNKKTLAPILQIKKEDPLKNMQRSIESFAGIIKEQKTIFDHLIQNTKEGWEKNTQNVKDIYQQLARIEKELEHLRELKIKLEEDLKKQKGN